MKNSYIILVLIISLSSCQKETTVSGGSSSPDFSNTNKATSYTSNEKQLLDEIVFIPCANNGTGENVHLTGSVHILIHTTLNKNNFTTKLQIQPQGIKGVGEITGFNYEGSGVTQQKISGSLSNGQSKNSFINNFNLVGKGKAPNYIVHENVNVVTNSNGTTTASVDNLHADCK